MCMYMYMCIYMKMTISTFFLNAICALNVTDCGCPPGPRSKGGSGEQPQYVRRKRQEKRKLHFYPIKIGVEVMRYVGVFT